jgi:hypothetical protein
MMTYVNRIAVLSVLYLVIPITVLAGNLDDPGAPTTAGGGALNTLEDIYNLINTGTTNSPRTGTFTEPSAGPASTGHTLTEIYDRAKTSSRPAKTGQTTSYRTHDDGDLQKGVTRPNPRFTEPSPVDGTVTDNLTGLMWHKDANLTKTQDYNPDNTGDGRVQWTNAFIFLTNLNNGTYGTGSSGNVGHTDWRLPNINELLSLICWAYSGPALSNETGTGQWTSGNPFTGVQSSSYWSSTTLVFNTDRAWRVELSDGNVSYYDKVSYAFYVWPVRGGQ